MAPRHSPAARFPKVRATSAGIHLFDRITATNVLLDEAQVPATLWSWAPRHVSVALTNSCDLHCPYCYAPKSSAKLNFDAVVRWLDELEAGDCIGVGFGGGEPTLHKDLPRICKYITTATQMAVTITTHAHHLDDVLVAALYGNVHFLRISMDGVGATYERNRGRSFKDLLRQLHQASRIAPLGINLVVNDRTVSDLDAAAALVAEYGVRELLLLPEQPRKGLGEIGVAARSALQSWVHAYRGPIRLSVSDAGSTGLPTCDALNREHGLSAYAHIDASGQLKRTSFDATGVTITETGVRQALRTLEHLSEDN